MIDDNEKEARFWTKLEDTKLQCHLCPHQCQIAEGKTGLCRVRRNSEGRLIASTYGRVAAAGMDPIEKKPLYHFHPTSTILSLGQAGCTFHCEFCQNCHMLNPDIPQQRLMPEKAVKLAADKSSFGIAYTYNEPWVGYEYVFDTARKAHEEGLKNVLVTNGFYMREPFEEIAPYIDAMNIDLKSMNEDFYPQYSRGRLSPVLETIERAYELGIHVELTTLLITGLNDSQEEVNDLVEYVAGLDKNIPLHISRYHPAYRMDRPSTPEDTMKMAYKTASEALNYVYLGNIMGAGGTDSFCPECGEQLISRRGFSTSIQALKEGQCRECGKQVNFVM